MSTPSTRTYAGVSQRHKPCGCGQAHTASCARRELREWASTVSQFMAEDKSNDWREEIAQLEAIEERLEGDER